MASDIGAVLNYRLFYFANKLGIITIPLISEGLQMETFTGRQLELEESWFYGDNFQKERVWDIKLIWSEYSRNMFWKYLPETKNYDLKVSGGTGFDRYKLFNYKNRKDKRIVEKKAKGGFTGTVLIVGYGFDIFNHIKPEDNAVWSEKEARWLFDQRHKVREIYNETILSNPGILFILKHHPGTDYYDETEFSRLAEKHENILEIKHGGEIGSIISSCDMVVAFDSTVCLEAWLLGKTTVLVNPESERFLRSNLYQGSPILKSSKELNQCITEYFSNYKIKLFEEKKDERKKCIECQIQYADGLNYLRAAKIINDYIKFNGNGKKQKASWIFIKNMINEIFSESKQFVIEKTFIGVFKKESKKMYMQRRKNFNPMARIQETQRYRKAIKRFEIANAEVVTGVCKAYDNK